MSLFAMGTALPWAAHIFRDLHLDAHLRCPYSSIAFGQALCKASAYAVYVINSMYRFQEISVLGQFSVQGMHVAYFSIA